jgi:hypothetical protein
VLTRTRVGTVGKRCCSKDTKFQLGVVVHPWNPSTQEAEAGGSRV